MTKTGYIYKLCIKDGSINDCYVGSTYRLRARRYKHKSACNNPNDKAYNYLLYRFIRENGGFDNWDLTCLDEMKYNNRTEIKACERRWIEKLKPSLNCKLPNRTQKEWIDTNTNQIRERNRKKRNENKEIIKVAKTEYYNKNKDKIKEYKKEYRLKNKEKILKKQKEFRDANKVKINERQKEQYAKNKDIFKARQKIYYDANKDKINERRRLRQCIRERQNSDRKVS
jgi:hypothetical protein